MQLDGSEFAAHIYLQYNMKIMAPQKEKHIIMVHGL